MENQNILNTVKHIHFIGIGGSGMCPIAEILYHRGYHITGSDISESETVQKIRSYQIPVIIGQKAENIKGADLIVYTAAVKKDNPELVAALESGIPTLERSEMLGVVTAHYQDSIAVSGTHGKTTTTGMLTQLFIQAGKDPSAIIGGKLPFIGSNGRAGKSDIMICEACEYVDTFLKLSPAISIILNIDADHLEYFGSLENIIKSFHQFSNQTGKVLIVNGDDENTKKYSRFQYVAAQIDDLTGEQLTCDNILIQYSYVTTYDGTSYKDIETITDRDGNSGGRGKYITRGKAIDVTWQKDSPWGVTHYITDDNQEVQLNPGTTWVEIVQDDRADDISYQ